MRGHKDTSGDADTAETDISAGERPESPIRGRERFRLSYDKCWRTVYESEGLCAIVHDFVSEDTHESNMSARILHAEDLFVEVKSKKSLVDTIIFNCHRYEFGDERVMDALYSAKGMLDLYCSKLRGVMGCFYSTKLRRR